MAKGKYAQWREPEGLTLLEGWARDGLTIDQIAHNCGITAKTLYEWQNKYGDIREALKRGKEVVDIEVENALLKRALGYEYLEESVEVTTSARGKKERRVRQVTKVVMPDVTAQIFWLKNRRPDKWSDKQKDSTGGDADEKVTVICDV